jgi:hypothetical protein
MIPDFPAEIFYGRISDIFSKIYLVVFHSSTTCAASKSASSARNRFTQICGTLRSIIFGDRRRGASSALRYRGMCFDCITWRSAA